jgi:hypothetical protein
LYVLPPPEAVDDLEDGSSSDVDSEYEGEIGSDHSDIPTVYGSQVEADSADD